MGLFQCDSAYQCLLIHVYQGLIGVTSFLLQSGCCSRVCAGSSLSLVTANRWNSQPATGWLYSLVWVLEDFYTGEVFSTVQIQITRTAGICSGVSCAHACVHPCTHVSRSCMQEKKLWSNHKSSEGIARIVHGWSSRKTECIQEWRREASKSVSVIPSFLFFKDRVI